MARHAHAQLVGRIIRAALSLTLGSPALVGACDDAEPRGEATAVGGQALGGSGGGAGRGGGAPGEGGAAATASAAGTGGAGAAGTAGASGGDGGGSAGHGAAGSGSGGAAAAGATGAAASGGGGSTAGAGGSSGAGGNAGAGGSAGAGGNAGAGGSAGAGGNTAKGGTAGAIAAGGAGAAGLGGGSAATSGAGGACPAGTSPIVGTTCFQPDGTSVETWSLSGGAEPWHLHCDGLVRPPGSACPPPASVCTVDTCDFHGISATAEATPQGDDCCYPTTVCWGGAGGCGRPLVVDTVARRASLVRRTEWC